jgi:hypothetical protein
MPALAARLERLQRRFDLIETLQNRSEQAATHACQRDFPIAALEQHHVELVFQRPQLLADGARGDAEGCGGRFDAVVTADFPERT